MFFEPSSHDSVLSTYENVWVACAYTSLAMFTFLQEVSRYKHNKQATDWYS